MYYQEIEIENIIFNVDLFYSISENNLKIGAYQIHNPYLACQTEDAATFLGNHTVNFKIVAECSPTFFLQFDVDWSRLTN